MTPMQRHYSDNSNALFHIICGYGTDIFKPPLKRESVDLWANRIPGSSSSPILTYLDMQLAYMSENSRDTPYNPYIQRMYSICQKKYPTTCTLLCFCCDLVPTNSTDMIQDNFVDIVVITNTAHKSHKPAKNFYLRTKQTKNMYIAWNVLRL